MTGVRAVLQRDLKELYRVRPFQILVLIFIIMSIAAAVTVVFVLLRTVKQVQVYGEDAMRMIKEAEEK